MGAIANGLFVAGAVAGGSLVSTAAEMGLLYSGEESEFSKQIRKDPTQYVIGSIVRNIMVMTPMVLPPAYALLRVMHTS